MNRVFRLSLFVAGMTVAIASVRGDVFVLKSGGRIEGELIGGEGSRSSQYRVKTAVGGDVTLERSQVARIDRRTSREREYERIRPTHSDTVDEQWALAEWCREHRLSDQRRKHLERVIELDPDHVQSRRALGYSRFDGAWKTREQLMLERGYVRYKGGWKLPTEVELLERDRKRSQAENAWFGKLKRLRQWLEDPERAETAADHIRTIEDSFALKALNKRRLEEPNPTVRLLYLEALARIGNPSAMASLVDVALNDPVEELRLTALDLLVERGRPRVTGLFAAALRRKQNHIVNRAAIGIGRLGDPYAVAPLIDALVTTHKFKVYPGGPPGSISTTLSRSSSGAAAPGASSSAGGPGMGLSVGGKPVVVTRQLQNREVLDALIVLTGVNFFYDLRRWKSWLASQDRIERLNARRD